MNNYGKARIFIKTTPASMGYLTKIEMNCNHCRQTVKKFNQPNFVPACQISSTCKLAAYISERLPNVEYKISDKKIPEVTIMTNSLEEIEKAQRVVNRAIKLHTHQIYRNCK